MQSGGRGGGQPILVPGWAGILPGHGTCQSIIHKAWEWWVGLCHIREVRSSRELHWSSSLTCPASSWLQDVGRLFSSPLSIQSGNQSNTRVAHLVACISNLVDIHICKFAVISYGLRWFEDTPSIFVQLPRQSGRWYHAVIRSFRLALTIYFKSD